MPQIISRHSARALKKEKLIKEDLEKVKKSLDHCHETGQFRNILCDYCNKIRY